MLMRTIVLIVTSRYGEALQLSPLPLRDRFPAIRREQLANMTAFKALLPPVPAVALPGGSERRKLLDQLTKIRRHEEELPLIVKELDCAISSTASKSAPSNKQSRLFALASQIWTPLPLSQARQKRQRRTKPESQS